MFASTIFISAFLLFLVQPMIARIILPWFGGTAAVWTTCMMFFQFTLLLGYLYSHWSTARLTLRKQTLIHLSLLTVSLLVLPVLPGPFWKTTGVVQQPMWRIVALLSATVGLPYLLLSATGPLLQAWYWRLNASRMPYRLYALSNAGSLLALLSYPVVVEPLLRSSHQAWGWSGCYVLFAGLCGLVAVRVLRRHDPEAVRLVSEAQSEPPGVGERMLWIGLAACPSALLLAITNHLSQNIAPIPLLWVVPLALYLLSLVMCFDSDRWYGRAWCIPILLISLGGMTYYMFPDRDNQRVETLGVLLPIFLVGLFISCLACHGELARRKPEARWLTLFYLLLSLGGALGGLFVALLAPVLFQTSLELSVSLLACALLVSGVVWSAWKSFWRWFALSGGVAVSAALVYLLTVSHTQWLREQHLVARNFYGALRTSDYDYGDVRVRYLVNGNIQHGAQVLNDKRHAPISYYGPNSGVGRAISDRQAAGRVRLGLIGLGSGILAAYGRPGDTVQFYEINPLVEQIARTEFSYLKESLGNLNVVLGDARRSLESEPPQQFDVLALDAFSSDAIPVHLLTAEAFHEYFRHLKPDGLLAVHISNRYLNLQWVVRLEAEAAGKKALYVSDLVEDDKNNPVMNTSDWMLVSNSPEAFRDPKWQKLGDPSARPPHLKLWTDDYSNLLAILE